MLVVLDTNILVSAFWSKNGIPKKVLDLALTRQIRPCFDYRLFEEYYSVLGFLYCNAIILYAL